MNLRHQIKYLGPHLAYLALVLQRYAVREQNVVEGLVVLVVGLFKLLFQSFDGIYCFSLSILYFVVQQAPSPFLKSMALPHWQHGNPATETPRLTLKMQVSVRFFFIESSLVILPPEGPVAERPLHPHLADYRLPELLTTLGGEFAPRADGNASR